MKKLLQTRLHNPPLVRGNCFPTVIACFMDKESPEEVIQIQEYYETHKDWWGVLVEWLFNRNWIIGEMQGHRYDDSYYLVTGLSPRRANTTHVCIYHNGKLWHDPHPDGTGILTEDQFEYLERI